MLQAPSIQLTKEKIPRARKHYLFFMCVLNVFNFTNVKLQYSCNIKLFCFMSLVPLIQLPQTEKWDNLIKTKIFFAALNPIGCGGGGPRSPSCHINVVPRKMLKEKLLIFFTFPRYGNGVLETTFCIKIRFGQTRAKMVKIGLVS